MDGEPNPGVSEGLKSNELVVRPERFELPAFWFVARRSIQLSYGRTFIAKILPRIGMYEQNPRCTGRIGILPVRISYL